MANINRNGKGEGGLPSQILISDEQEEKGGPSPADMDLAKRCVTTLQHHYPGYPWCVQVTSEQGIVFVKLLNVPGYERLADCYGIMLKLPTVYMDPNLKCIMRAGGELLERWGQIRAGLVPADWETAQADFPDIKEDFGKRLLAQGKIRQALKSSGIKIQ